MDTKVVKVDIEEAGNFHWENTSHIGSLVDCRDNFQVEIHLKNKVVLTPFIGHDHQSNYAYEAPVREEGQSVVDCVYASGNGLLDVEFIRIHRVGHDDILGREYDEWEIVTTVVFDSHLERQVKQDLVYANAKKLLDGEMCFANFVEFMQDYK